MNSEIDRDFSQRVQCAAIFGLCYRRMTSEGQDEFPTAMKMVAKKQ